MPLGRPFEDQMLWFLGWPKVKHVLLQQYVYIHVYIILYLYCVLSNSARINLYFLLTNSGRIMRVTNAGWKKLALGNAPTES